MSIEAALRLHLLADATISGLVGTRVHPLGEHGGIHTYPMITYQRVSSQHFRHLNAGSGVASPRFQLNCMAENFSGSASLGNAVRERIDNHRGNMGSGDDIVFVYHAEVADQDDEPQPDDDGSERFLFIRRIDVIVMHQETVT